MKSHVIFRKYRKKIQVSFKCDKNDAYFHEDLYTFVIVYRSVLLRMRDVSDKSCTGNRYTHFMFNNFFFRKSCLFEQMWKKYLGPDRPQMTIWHIRIVCWVNMAADTHLEYLILFLFYCKSSSSKAP